MSKVKDLCFKKGKFPAFMFVTGHVIKPHNGFNNFVPAGENLGLWEKLFTYKPVRFIGIVLKNHFQQQD
jgi:hypothetical protein